jgi:8-oxo-dGTP diphosphatase
MNLATVVQVRSLNIAMAPLKTKPMAKPYYHVAVGAIIRDEQVLIAKRAAHKLQGDRWEFPGGKLEQNEKVLDGLTRELQEELGITPTQARPLIQIPYDYSEFSCLLDVHLVSEFSGTPKPLEQQAPRWVPIARLDEYPFPDANVPIVRALQLPSIYKIIDPCVECRGSILCCPHGHKPEGNKRLLRLRQQDYLSEYSAISNLILDLPAYNDDIPVAGLHLTSKELYQFEQRPIAKSKLLGASLHTEQDVQQANKLQCDFAVLSPVKPTPSHPDATPIAWQKFQDLIYSAHFPVYALGGMTPDDLEIAWAHGAQGVAGIRYL